MQQEKTCLRCNVVKILDNFSKKENKKDGRQAWCKACVANYDRNRSKKFPDVKRTSKWKYQGIINSDGSQFTQIDFDRLYQIQSGKCGICGVHQSILIKRLHVDHNHSTGVVRGLLCNLCNIHLGLLEREEFIKKANEYLRKSK